MSRLAIVILAAGNSRRFGGVKQLAEIDGKPMLQLVIDHCCSVCEAELFVALGAGCDEILAKLDLKGARVLEIEEWSQGVGSTISNSVEQIQQNYEGILFIAGDQPAITSDSLAPLIDCWRARPDLACCASYNATLGIPAIFPQRLFSDLCELSGDQGAKPILLAENEHLRQFEMPQAAVDIDWPEDICRIGGSLKD